MYYTSIRICVWFFASLNTPLYAMDQFSEHSLNEVINNGLSGLQFEDLQKQQQLRLDAKIFEKQAYPKSHRRKFLTHCEKKPGNNLFCPIAQALEAKRDLSSRLNSNYNINSKNYKNNRHDYVRWLKESEVEKLLSVREDQLEDALKEFTEFSSIEKLIVRLTNSPSCKHATLLKALSAKAEEFFPNSEVQRQVIPLYETLASCSESPYSVPARFRVSLLYIWQGKCKDALTHLSVLSDRLSSPSRSSGPSQEVSSYYASRVLFWTMSCNAQRNEAYSLNLANQAKKKLLEKYPFSFHALLTEKASPEDRFPFFVKSDSSVKFRSEKNSALNTRLAAVEALMVHKKYRLAAEVLEAVDDEIENADPQLRLYVSAIYSRLGQYQKSFKTLASIFDESPNLISQASLRLSFPPLYSKHLTRLDRSLLLSLIRQESAFNEHARSSAGALGLMQILPTTARQFGQVKSRRKLFDPMFNVQVGSKYFSSLLRRYQDRAELALAAYNAGPSRVDLWLKRYEVSDRILFLDLIPFKETRSYVACIARNYYWYNTLYPSSDKVSRLGPVFGHLGNSVFN